jgi:hypothetical protein
MNESMTIVGRFYLTASAYTTATCMIKLNFKKQNPELITSLIELRRRTMNIYNQLRQTLELTENRGQASVG